RSPIGRGRCGNAAGRDNSGLGRWAPAPTSALHATYPSSGGSSALSPIPLPFSKALYFIIHRIVAGNRVSSHPATGLPIFRTSSRPGAAPVRIQNDNRADQRHQKQAVLQHLAEEPRLVISRESGLATARRRSPSKFQTVRRFRSEERRVGK